MKQLYRCKRISVTESNFLDLVCKYMLHYLLILKLHKLYLKLITLGIVKKTYNKILL